MNQKFSGTWHNQYGSELRLEVSTDGRIAGKFRTNVGRAEARDQWQETWFDVTGFVNNDLISFVINYHSIGTLSAVSGRLKQGDKGPRIEALGYTSFNFEPQDHWRSTAVTTNIYEPGPSPAF